MTPATFNFLVSLIENDVAGDINFTGSEDIVHCIMSSCIEGFTNYIENDIR